MIGAKTPVTGKSMTFRILGILALASSFSPAEKAGCDASAGCLKNPRTVERLEITKSGTYENILVDSQWQPGNRVKITANDVTLRHCEIRNATGNGIAVFGKNVTIENCRIHHLLAGTFKNQKDAHGITGGWGNVTIRNCEIFQTSGDSVQFDPDRKSLGRVVIENCTFWTGPLSQDAAGFLKGETPGENAVDTKVRKGEPARCELVIRDSWFYGWKQPGQVNLLAALNLKENITANISGCVFTENQVALRLRGPGEHGGAHVNIDDCSIHDCAVGMRIEDMIEQLEISGISFGPNVVTRYHKIGGGHGEGFINVNEKVALPVEELLVITPEEKRG
jgi:hypothetical protein